MLQNRHQRHLLYLLAAFILLLQSFAVWHDASHAFHIAEEQCERFDAIQHIPTLDLTPVISVSFSPLLLGFITVDTVQPVVDSRQENHPIRAPPVFS